MSKRTYRVDFALIRIAGNHTRYLTFRPLIERDASVISRWKYMRTYADDSRYDRIPSKFRSSVRNALNLIDLLRSRPDAVVIHAYESYLHFGIMHRWLGRKSTLLYWYDGTYAADTEGFGSGIPEGLPRWLKRYRKTALDRTDFFIPWSNFAASSTVALYPAASARIEVIHPGINLSEWPKRPAPEVTDGRYRILFVGGDALRKGLDTLLDAFEGGLNKHCELAIATSSSGIPANLRSRAMSLTGVSLHLDLAPGSRALRGMYSAADVFVLPTRLDLSSLAALEAMATGVPVVITAVGGIPDIVIDNDTGLIVEPDSATDIIRAVDRLRLDSELRQRLVGRAREHVEKHFDASANAQRILEIVKALVDESAARRSR
jgi:glycosyltransferase involved in cell wall biosynthesis